MILFNGFGFFIFFFNVVNIDIGGFSMIEFLDVFSEV